MFNKIMSGIVATSLLLFPIYAWSSDNIRPNRVRVEQKVIELGDRIVVKGIGVNDINPLYYYELDKLNLSEDEKDELAEDISNRILDKLTKVLEEVLNSGKVPVPTPPEEEPKEPVTLTEKANVIFLKYKCNECHGIGRKEAGFALYNEQGIVLLDRDRKWDVFDQVETDKMPKGTNIDKLDDTEVQLIREWAREH